jgi:hypothetical protein
VLIWHGLASDARFYRATVAVTQDYDQFGFEHADGVFEAGDHVRGGEVSGDPRDEQMADGLVEEDFDGHAGIGAGEDGGEGFLFFERFVSEDSEIFVERSETVLSEALIACA